jgi:hypothetical protein
MQEGRGAGDGGAAGNRTAASVDAVSVVLEAAGRPGLATHAGVDGLLGGCERRRRLGERERGDEERGDEADWPQR